MPPSDALARKRRRSAPVAAVEEDAVTLGQRVDDLDRGAAWAAAEWLAHRPDVGTAAPAEVAVPVLDASGAAVGALAADLSLDPGTDPATPAGEARAAEVAAYLTRAAKAAGRTLGHG